MRILCFSSLQTAFDLDGSPCAALSRELAECEAVEMYHILVAAPGAFEDLVRRKCVFPVAGYYLPGNARVNIRPLTAPHSKNNYSLFSRRVRSILDEWQPDIAHVWDVRYESQLHILRLLRDAGIATAVTYEGKKLGRPSPSQTIADLAGAVFVTSRRLAQEFESKSPNLVGPLVDCKFWTEPLAADGERHLLKNVVPENDEASSCVVCPVILHASRPNRMELQFLFSLIRDVARRVETAQSPRTHFVIVVFSPETQGPARRELETLINEFAVGRVVSVAETRPLLLRALFRICKAVLLSGGEDPRFSLEAMAMACVPLAPEGSAAAAYIENGTNGLLYDLTSVADAADKLQKIISSEDVRTRMAAVAKSAAEQFAVTRHAAAYLDVFKTMKADDEGKTKRGPTNQAETGEGVTVKNGTVIAQNVSALSPDTSDWIRNTVLALDLDLTLIKFAPIFETRPTPFPIGSPYDLKVKCDLGRTYCVRGGLDALERILQLPWRAKVVWSMADQEKVDQAVRQIRIGSQSLMDWTNAWVGNELLNAFAGARGFSLTFHSERQLSSPHGETARAKPSQFLQLEQMQSLGLALLNNDRESALQIVTAGQLRPNLGLVIDDQPYLEPPEPSIVCYRVLPFRDVEDLEQQCGLPADPALVFNFLDHTWRSTCLPFHFLADLLEQRPGWEEFRRRLNTEYEISDALRHADSIRQMRWMRAQAIPSRLYRDFLAKRRTAERKLMLARYRQHAAVYRTLAEDCVTEDVRQGWIVLLLGRDMDYAFGIIRHLYPELVRQRKIALLPLSRVALGSADDQCLLDLLHQSLPDLRSSENVGIRIYDVGFHGRIPARIAQVMRRSSGTLNKKVEARLFNRCSCSNQKPTGCTGELIRFVDWRGDFAVSRSFGISIERCPHRTGPAEKIVRAPECFEFQFSAQSPSESRRAQRLEKLMEAGLLKGKERIRNRPDPLRLVAHQAMKALRRKAPRKLGLFQRNALALAHVSRSPLSKEVKLVTYPFCGTDLLTPHVCFHLERLILIDRIPASAQWDECDPVATAGYLADLMALFRNDFIQASEGLLRVRKSWTERLTNIDESHTLALVSICAFLSMLRLLPAADCYFERVASEPSSPHLSPVAWTVNLEQGHSVTIEYHTCTIGLGDKDLHAYVKQASEQSFSALILKGASEFLSEVGSPAFQDWVHNASVILHDVGLASAGSGLDGVAHLLDGFTPIATSMENSVRSGNPSAWNRFQLLVGRDDRRNQSSVIRESNHSPRTDRRQRSA